VLSLNRKGVFHEREPSRCPPVFRRCHSRRHVLFVWRCYGAEHPKEQKPADKMPPPQLDTFGDDGTPTFKDVPTPTFQPQPLIPAKQDDKEKEQKEKKDKGDGVVTIQSALPDLKYGGVTITPVGGAAGDSGIPGQPATLTITI
jgi:hypothetical protein